MSRREIDLDDSVDRWRFRCPAGHANWEPTNNHFFCTQCSRSLDEDHDPVFQELRDQRTDGLLERDEVELVGYEDHLRHVAGD